MLRKINFILKSFYLSVSSSLWGYVHKVYENSFSIKKTQGEKDLRILIVQLGQIGDFIISLPLIAALKEHYGENLRLSLLIDPINERIAQKYSASCNLIFYRARKYTRHKAEPDNDSFSPQGTKATLTNSKSEMYDEVIWLRGDLRTFLWIVRKRIPLKSITKYPNPVRLSWLSLVFPLRIERKYSHFIETLDLLYQGIVKPSDYPWSKIISLYDNDAQRHNKGKIFIHISAGNELRRWPVERFAALSRFFLNYDTTLTIHYIGSNEDYSIAETIKGHDELQVFSSRLFNQCGKVRLEELAGFLSKGTLYIGFDSGPMHIAAMSGVPIVAMMGPQSPHLFRPWGKQAIKVIYKDFYCSPCWQFSCFHVQSGPGPCILAIQPEEVFKEAKSIWESVRE